MIDKPAKSSAITITGLLRDLAADLAEAAAIAKAAVTCAEAGSEAEAVRIVIKLDISLSEAQTLHSAVCLFARRQESAIIPDLVPS